MNPTGSAVSAGFTQSSSINLGTLGNNGGSTQTIPLLTGSAAIDAGDDAACPATDQRGVTRPQGTACDIGAYEVNSFPPETKIDAAPALVSRSSSGSVFFSSSQGAGSFECWLDGAEMTPLREPASCDRAGGRLSHL